MSKQPLKRDPGEPWRVHLSRIGVGMAAGAVVALVKYAGSDAEVAARVAEANFPGLLLRMLGYSVLPIILGGVGGWISDERKVHKIFWVAVSAPVILAAAAGGSGAPKPSVRDPLMETPGRAGWNLFQLFPLAYAEGVSLPASRDGTAAAAQPRGASPSNPFLEGLQIFLGGGRSSESPRYRVVVHSVQYDRDKAEMIAKRLNKEFDLPAPATVADRKPGNEYWPIVINGWTTYQEARRLRDIVADMNFRLDDKPYISVEGR